MDGSYGTEKSSSLQAINPVLRPTSGPWELCTLRISRRAVLKFGIQAKKLNVRMQWSWIWLSILRDVVVICLPLFRLITLVFLVLIHLIQGAQPSIFVED